MSQPAGRSPVGPPLDLEPIKRRLARFDELKQQERETGRASSELFDIEDEFGHYDTEIRELIHEVERLRAEIGRGGSK